MEKWGFPNNTGLLLGRMKVDCMLGKQVIESTTLLKISMQL